MNREKFKKDMAVFSPKQHRAFLTYLTVLKANSWTIEDAKLWIEEENKRLIEEQELFNKLYSSKICLVCGKYMSLLPVNTDPSDQTGDPTDLSVWFCNSCGESIYNKEDIANLIK